ncbi:hypothetical protein DPX39_000033000 [Trypanosoma brucei equiperdum]|uniref:Uncharacterized protein n=1 Tax=Trypanosoma brucei equiperdum TaxID=630700 RepID=A0A3L6KT05_9TRYP|nr:hypothetical protein DPX39_000033000 [Trypanosoma brucei equiperdum]
MQRYRGKQFEGVGTHDRMSSIMSMQGPKSQDIRAPYGNDEDLVRRGSSVSCCTSSLMQSGVGRRRQLSTGIRSPPVEFPMFEREIRTTQNHMNATPRSRTLRSPFPPNERGNENESTPLSAAGSSNSGNSEKNNLDEFVTCEPVEVVNGMNRVCVYVPSSKGAETPRSGALKITFPAPERSMGTASYSSPPVMRFQPLYSPSLPYTVPSPVQEALRSLLEEAAQRQQLGIGTSRRQSFVCNTGVQTEPGTEVESIAPGQTVESDDTHSNRAQENEQAPLSCGVSSPVCLSGTLSSMSSPRSPREPRPLMKVGETERDEGDSKVDTKPAPGEQQEQKDQARNEEREREGTKEQRDVGSAAPSVMSVSSAAESSPTEPLNAATTAEQPRGASACVFIDLHGICSAKNGKAAAGPPIRVHVTNPIPGTNTSGTGHNTNMDNVDYPMKSGLMLNQQSERCRKLASQMLGHETANPQPTALSTAPWYLRTSLVVEPNEFKSLLRNSWRWSSGEHGGPDNVGAHVSSSTEPYGHTADIAQNVYNSEVKGPRPTAPDSLVEGPSRSPSHASGAPRPKAQRSKASDGKHRGSRRRGSHSSTRTTRSKDSAALRTRRVSAPDGLTEDGPLAMSVSDSCTQRSKGPDAVIDIRGDLNPSITRAPPPSSPSVGVEPSVSPVNQRNAEPEQHPAAEVRRKQKTRCCCTG